MPLILILVGIVYIAETLSDIIQVVYFKATHGKRIFKMAPPPPPFRDVRMEGEEGGGGIFRRVRPLLRPGLPGRGGPVPDLSADCDSMLKGGEPCGKIKA